eukprot:IDg4749t1
MNLTARFIDLCLLDRTWALENASSDAISLDAASPLRLKPASASRTVEMIQGAVLRAPRCESSVDRGLLPRVLLIADRCGDLNSRAVDRVRYQSTPLMLKDLCRALLCRLVMQSVRGAEKIAFFMQKTRHIASLCSCVPCFFAAASSTGGAYHRAACIGSMQSVKSRLVFRSQMKAVAKMRNRHGNTKAIVLLLPAHKWPQHRALDELRHKLRAPAHAALFQQSSARIAVRTQRGSVILLRPSTQPSLRCCCATTQRRRCA